VPPGSSMEPPLWVACPPSKCGGRECARRCHVTSTLMLENLACSLLSSLSSLVIAAPWPQLAEAELAEAEAAVAEAVVAPAAWARSAAQQLSGCGRESSVNAARRHVRSTSDSILSSRRVLIPHTHTHTSTPSLYRLKDSY